MLRERVPPLTAIPLPRAVDERLLHQRWPVRELAAPPPGSGLKPVLGDAGAPLVGHTLDSMRFGVEFALAWYRRYGSVSWMGAFGQRIAVLSGPDAAQVALVNKDKAFSQGGWSYFLGPFFRRGLMLLDFDEHLLHRRIMQEAFTRDRLAGYLRDVGPVLREGVAAWDARPRLYWALKRLTLEAAAQVFMGRRDNGANATINRAFVASVRAPTAVVRFPVPGGRWAAGLAGRRLLEGYFRAELPGKRRAEGDDLFSALCHARDDEGQRFSDDDIVNHMIFLMMAAHDTTTITSTAAAYHLAKHPEWQERARAESLALGDDLPDLEALDRLETLELVIKESMRLTAPVPSLARRTVADTDVLGHYLPASTLISLSLNVSHYSAEHWSDPYRFDPERFAEGRREDRSHRFAWMPFGGGAHKCIGLHFGRYEVKALLHEMLRRYRWSVPDSYRLRWDYVSLPVPIDGLPIQLDAAGSGGQGFHDG